MVQAQQEGSEGGGVKITLIFLVMLMGGCSSSYDAHQIQKISKLCGGVDKISSMWLSVDVARAYCMDGKLVTQDD